jgi:asparagine synthase (glutamine-hydrolysing)
MCGISALIALPYAQNGDPEHIDHEALKKQMQESLDLIKHRGPDYSGIWISGDRRIGVVFLLPFVDTDTYTGHVTDSP